MDATRTRRHRGAVVGLVMVACLVLSGCADNIATSSKPAPQAPEPGRSGAASYISKTYRFDLTSSCGERGFLGTYRVSVQGGVVIAARPLGPSSYQPDLAEVPSLQGLVELAGNTEPEADVVLLRDPAGLPTELRIDHVPNAVDDEECYAIDNIRRLHRWSRPGKRLERAYDWCQHAVQSGPDQRVSNLRLIPSRNC